MSRPDPPAGVPLSAPTGRPDDPGWYTGWFELALYLLAGVTYIGFGMFHKFLLNWIIGPLFITVWAWYVPVLQARWRERRRP